MNLKQFTKFLVRDDGHCYHCGTTEGLVPQHRIGGMGGRRNQSPANIITFCGVHNELIESDAWQAELARAHGWKLRPWEDPLVRPVYDRSVQAWFFLDNYFHRTVAG
jgi:hypothetical protein